jgi:hypothetical protein
VRGTTRVTGIALAIAACDAPPPPAPAVAKPARADAAVPVEPPPSCVPWNDDYALANAKAVGSAFDICFEKICRDHDTYEHDPTCHEHTCWSFDLASNAWRFSDRRAPPNKPVVPETTHVVRSDGAYAADWDVDTVHLTDRAGKLVHTFKSWRSVEDLGGVQRVQFLDDTLAIFVSHGAETEEAHLYEPQTGKLLRAVAPPNGIYAPTPLGNHLFAFFEVPAIQMLVVDVSTGKLVRQVKIQPDQEHSWVPQLVVPLPDRSIAIVVDNLVVRVDPSGAVTRFAAPACAPGNATTPTR